jgi:hypothetical protein
MVLASFVVLIDGLPISAATRFRSAKNASFETLR